MLVWGREAAVAPDRKRLPARGSPQASELPGTSVSAAGSEVGSPQVMESPLVRAGRAGEQLLSEGSRLTDQETTGPRQVRMSGPRADMVVRSFLRAPYKD